MQFATAHGFNQENRIIQFATAHGFNHGLLDLTMGCWI
jgi:hypothetical protein